MSGVRVVQVTEGDSRYMSKELLNHDLFFDDDDDASFSEKGPPQRDLTKCDDKGPPQRDLTKCDIFSLGATCFELVTEQPLPPNGSEWHAIRAGFPEVPVDTPPELASAVFAMMHPKPAQRPHARDLLQLAPLRSELERLAQELERERTHVAQYRNDVVRLSKQRLARSNTWAG